MSIDVDKIIRSMMSDIPGFEVSYGGTGGYKEVKPLPTPVQKLAKYTKENNVKLQDLFLIFDKEKRGELTEEEFRDSLKVRHTLCIGCGLNSSEIFSKLRLSFAM